MNSDFKEGDRISLVYDHQPYAIRRVVSVDARGVVTDSKGEKWKNCRSAGRAKDTYYTGPVIRLTAEDDERRVLRHRRLQRIQDATEADWNSLTDAQLEAVAAMLRGTPKEK